MDEQTCVYIWFTKKVYNVINIFVKNKLYFFWFKTKRENDPQGSEINHDLEIQATMKRVFSHEGR